MSEQPIVDRRTLLKLLALSPLAAAAAGAPSARAWTSTSRKVVLIELVGGNDGLNTLIPIKDPLYKRLRPTLAIDDKDALGVGAGMALHPSLKKLATLFEKGELAIVQGVGYAKPVRSHFRSSDIWHTGSASEEVRSDGWIARVLPNRRGLIVGGDAGPLDGPHFSALAADGDKPSRRTEREATNAALAHLARVHDEVKRGRAEIESAIGDDLPTDTNATRDGKNFAAQCRVAAAALEKLDVAVVKLTLKGFDTHAGQRDTHARLLEQLSTGILELSQRARTLGIWNDVVVVTTSEFGRRARENGSGGTDHGTAAPLFVLGGRVRGGLKGSAPRLDDLDEEGDVKFTTDYRAVLGGVAVAGFGLVKDDVKRSLGNVEPLALSA